MTKLKSTGVPLSEKVNDRIYRGVLTGLNEAFVIDEETKDRLVKQDSKSLEVIKPFLAGRDVKRYEIDFQYSYLIFTRRGVDIDSYPAIRDYLETYRDRLEPKPKNHNGDWKGRKSGNYLWYEIQDSIEYFEEFETKKLILPDISLRGNFALDDGNDFYCVNTCYIIPIKEDWLEPLLNSKLLTFYYENVSPEFRGGYLRYTYQYLVDLPVTEAASLTKYSDQLKNQLNERRAVENGLVKLVQSKFPIDKPSKKLQNWPDLDFKGFLLELKKKKVKLSLGEEAEWLTHFNNKKTEANAIRLEIDRIDKQIDQMVYELYDLSEEEKDSRSQLMRGYSSNPSLAGVFDGVGRRLHTSPLIQPWITDCNLDNSNATA